jgi:hypothetical protein
MLLLGGIYLGNKSSAESVILTKNSVSFVAFTLSLYEETEKGIGVFIRRKEILKRFESLCRPGMRITRICTRHGRKRLNAGLIMKLNFKYDLQLLSEPLFHVVYI